MWSVCREQGHPCSGPQGVQYAGGWDVHTVDHSRSTKATAHLFRHLSASNLYSPLHPSRTFPAPDTPIRAVSTPGRKEPVMSVSSTSWGSDCPSALASA